MPKERAQVVLSVTRAREDLARALARLEVLDADDRKRVSYSVHALNNYLMVVANTLHILRAKLDVKGDREVRRWLDSLEHATNLMMSTARGVLAVTPDVQPLLLFEPASLSEIAEGACRAYRDIAKAKRVRILWRAPGRPDRVVTDRVAAGAVMDNLLSNAVKYSPSGTAVSVVTTVEAGEVVCSVRDHGPGLTAEDQEKLFQRGVRLSPQPTGGESSTGFGLAIAHDLTQALGGRLACSSVAGAGSCFIFALPLEREEAAPAAMEP